MDVFSPSYARPRNIYFPCRHRFLFSPPYHCCGECVLSLLCRRRRSRKFLIYSPHYPVRLWFLFVSLSLLLRICFLFPMRKFYFPCCHRFLFYFSPLSLLLRMCFLPLLPTPTAGTIFVSHALSGFYSPPLIIAVAALDMFFLPYCAAGGRENFTLRTIVGFCSPSLSLLLWMSICQC